MGAVVMTLLIVVVLAVGVVESRDRVRRDYLTDKASLRDWYEARYPRGGRAMDRQGLQRSLHQTLTLRRWAPLALSGGTLLVAVTLTVFAASTVPGVLSAWAEPQKILGLVPAEVLVETAIVFVLLPILVIEGILAVLYTVDLDIGRLQRLLESLD